MLDVQRRLAVAEFVAVLDVVVDERRFVKRFDREGRAADDVGEPAGDLVGAVGLRAVAAGERVVRGQRDERPRVLAALGEEVVGDGFGGGDAGRGRRPLAVHFGQPWSAARARDEPLQFVRLEHPSGRASKCSYVGGVVDGASCRTAVISSSVRTCFRTEPRRESAVAALPIRADSGRESRHCERPALQASCAPLATAPRRKCERIQPLMIP